ncbi:MAG: BrnA antitoxin family protein [Candidatus Korobacteraceae bacterium]
MKNRPDPDRLDDENPEWTAEDFRRAIPFSDLPASEQEKLRSLKKHRGPQKTPTKQLVSIRLSQDVVSNLRASGRGWQARVDEHLRAWLQRNKRKRA